MNSVKLVDDNSETSIVDVVTHDKSIEKSKF